METNKSLIKKLGEKIKILSYQSEQRRIEKGSVGVRNYNYADLVHPDSLNTEFCILCLLF